MASRLKSKIARPGGAPTNISSGDRSAVGWTSFPTFVEIVNALRSRPASASPARRSACPYPYDGATSK